MSRNRNNKSFNRSMEASTGTFRSITTNSAHTVDQTFTGVVNFAPGSTIIGTITPALPTILENIVDLSPLTGGNMIYSTGTDDWLATPITTEGIGLVGTSGIPSMRSFLGLTIGVDVQGYNSSLDGISALNPFNVDDMFYASGPSNFQKFTTAVFGRSLLNATNEAGLRTLVDAVGRAPTSTNTAIALHDGSNNLLDTGILVDGSDNLTMPGSANLVMGTGELGGITEAERTQLQNINGTSISTLSWTHVGTMDQDVATTSQPTFDHVTATTATTGADPALRLVTKGYVDAASSGVSPLDSVFLATDDFLPNTPEYDSPAQTLTSTAGAGTELVVDDVTLVVGDNGKRILVKNQSDNRENGIYIVTDYGGGASPWQLTRASDFNQATTPINAGSATFVSIGSGGTLDGTTWSLQNTVNTLDPLTDPVTFTQTAGGVTYTASNGITLVGLDFQIDAPLAVSLGGTGTTSHTLGNVLVGNNTGAVLSTKIAPTGVFVGTTDVQPLSNKTITDASNLVRATQLGTTGADVVVNTSGPPTTGQALVATSATAAEWQSLGTTKTQVITVDAGGRGDFTTIGAALASIPGSLPPHVTAPSGSNPIVIQISPGTYTENNPLIVPRFVSISGIVFPSRIVTVIPTDVNANGFEFPFVQSYIEHVRVVGLTGANAAAFFISNSQPGISMGISNCTAVDCDIGFYSSGTLSPTQTSVCIGDGNSVVNNSHTAQYAFKVDGGGVMQMSNVRFSGDSGLLIDEGVSISGNGSFGLFLQSRNNFCNKAFTVTDQSTLTLLGGNINNYNVGLEMGAGGSIARANDVIFEDNTATNPSQISIRTLSGSQLLQANGIILRSDSVQLDSGTLVIGNALGLNPGEISNQFLGELSVGLPGRGFETVMGEGDSHTFGLSVFQFDSVGVGFTDISSIVNTSNGSTADLFLNNVAGDILYIGEDITMGPNQPFQGIKLLVDTAVSPAGGQIGTAEPPTYYYTWEYWDGTDWREFSFMTTDSDSPYTPKRRGSFFGGSQQIRFDRINDTGTVTDSTSGANVWIAASKPASQSYWFDDLNGLAWPNWTTTTVNGVNGYWVRVRQTTSGLVTVPTIDQIKLHTNRTEVNADGYIEKFGKARVWRRLSQNIITFSDNASNSAGNQDVYLSDRLNRDINVGNEFVSSAIDRITAAFPLPAYVDTSHPMKITWQWGCQTADLARVQWTVSWAYVRNYNLAGLGTNDVVYTSSAAAPAVYPTERSITFTAPTEGVTNAQITSTCIISIDNLVSRHNIEGDGDVLWVGLERDGGAVPDTYSGNVTIFNIDVLALKYCNGEQI